MGDLPVHLEVQILDFKRRYHLCFRILLLLDSAIYFPAGSLVIIWILHVLHDTDFRFPLPFSHHRTPGLFPYQKDGRQSVLEPLTLNKGGVKVNHGDLVSQWALSFRRYLQGFQYLGYCFFPLHLPTYLTMGGNDCDVMFLESR